MKIYDAATENALSSGAFKAALFVQMNYTSATINFSSWNVPIVWNGITWLPTGSLGAVERVENSLGATNAVNFSLSGVPSENLALALSESARNRRVYVYFAVLDPDTEAVLSAQIYWSGVMDNTTINESKEGSRIAVTSKHFSELFSRVKSIRYTDGDQKKISSTDTGLRFIASQSQTKDVWPAAAFFRQ